MNKLSEIAQSIKDKTGWSQAQLAAEAGVSQPTINRILLGQGDCKGSTLQALLALQKRTAARRTTRI